MRRLLFAALLSLSLGAPALAQLEAAWSDVRPVGALTTGYAMARVLLPAPDGSLFTVLSAHNTPENLVILRRHASDGSFLGDTLGPVTGLTPVAAFLDGSGGVRTLCSATATPQLPAGLVLLSFDGLGGSTLLQRWDLPGYEPANDPAVAAQAADGTLWAAVALGSAGSLQVRKFDADGAPLATAALPGFPEAQLRSIALEPQGGAVLGGNFGSEPSVWALDASLALRWTRVVPATPTYSLPSYIGQVLVDERTGTILAGGSIYPHLWMGRGILRAWAADGTPLWSEDLTTPIGGHTRVDSIALSSDRRLWASVRVGVQSFDSRSLLCCRDLDGTRNFEHLIAPPGTYGLNSTQLVPATAGRVMMFWSVPNQGQSWYTDGWLCELDSEGNVREQRLFGVPQWLEGLGGLVLAEGRAYLCGYAVQPAPQGATPWVLAVDTGALPSEICHGTPSAAGCETVLTCSGRASVSDPFGLVLHATGLANRSDALLVYGLQGSVETPFAAGWRCVAPPLVRTPATSTGGSHLPVHDCSGRFALRFDRLALRDPALATAGTDVTAQIWCRDSANPAGAGYLSQALHFSVQP